MRTIELGRTGEKVSQIALGAMQMGTVQDEETSFALLDRYLEAGGSFIDTANAYMWWHRRGSSGGESEELLGRWMSARGNRDEVFLATKVGGMVTDLDAVWTPDGERDWDNAWRYFEGAARATLLRAIDESLRRLGTDRVDLWYVHVDDRSTPLEETLETLAEIVASGKVRHIGWSNVHTWRLERIRQLCDRYGWPAPVAVQQRYTYLRPSLGRDHVSNVAAEQRDYLTEHDDLTLVAYSPILQGAYENPEKRDGPGLIDQFRSSESDARLDAVDEVAAACGASQSQVVLSWLLAQRDPKVIPLIGPRTLQQYDALVGALDVELTSDQLERLDTASA